MEPLCPLMPRLEPVAAGVTLSVGIPVVLVQGGAARDHRAKMKFIAVYQCVVSSALQERAECQRAAATPASHIISA